MLYKVGNRWSTVHAKHVSALCVESAEFLNSNLCST